MNTRQPISIKHFSKAVLCSFLSLLILLSFAPTAASAFDADIAATGVAYELWLGSKQVTSTNQNDIFGTGQASFDPNTNTLTLSNPSISGVYTDSAGATYKIASKNTDLIVKGSYHMTEAQADYGIASINGGLTLDGSFTFKGDDTGVYAYDTVSVQSGELTAVGNNINGVLSAMGNIRIEPDALKVDAKGGDSAITSGEFAGYSLLVGGDLYISEPYGAKIKKTDSGSEYITDSDGKKATRAVIEPVKKYDLWVGYQQVDSRNASDIFGDGKAKYNPLDHMLTLKDPNLVGGHTDSDSKTYMIYSKDYLTVKGSYHMNDADTQYGIGVTGGRLSLIGDFTFIGSTDGVYAKYDIDVKSATLKAVGESGIGIRSESGYVMFESMAEQVEAIGSQAGLFAEKLYLSEDHRIDAPEGGSFADNYIREADGITVAKRVFIKTIKRYGLWLGSTRVTSENADDILGDGAASFDYETSTLTLSDPTIPDVCALGSYTYKIYSSGIDLTVSGSYRMPGGDADWGIVSDHGDLTLKGYFEFYGGSMSAIGCNRNITIDGSVTTYGGSSGIMAYENITVGGGYCHIYNCSTGISSYKKIIFKGSEQLVVINAYEKAVSADKIEIDNADGERLVIRDPFDGTISGAGDTIIDDEGRIAKRVMLQQAMQYAVWVGSTRVSDLNRKDIFGDGKASFNPMSNTLTLSNPNITGSFTDNYGNTHKIYASNLYLTVKGSYHMSYSETTYGISSYNGTLILSGSFTFRGSQYGIYADDVSAQSGSVKAFGDQKIGVYSLHNLYVMDNVSYIEIQGGEKAIYLITGGLSLSGDLTVVNPSGGTFKNSTVYKSDGSTIAKYVYIKPLKKYSLWVGGTQVTEDNKNNIVGDGKASFDPTTGVLTINNAYVTGTCTDADNVGAKFYAEDMDLTVKGSYDMWYSDTQIGIEIRNGSLTLDGDFTFRGTYAGLTAKNAGSVTLKDGEMLLQGGYQSGMAVYGGNLVIRNADVTAYGGSYGVDTDSGIKISGDSSFTADGSVAALNGAASLTLSGGLGITDPEKSVFSAGDKTIIDQNSQKAKHIVISKTSAVTYILGDTNGDNEVNVLDATIIQRYMAKLSVPDADRAEICGDVNGDGLSILDATAIQRKLAKLSAPSGIGEVIS